MPNRRLRRGAWSLLVGGLCLATAGLSQDQTEHPMPAAAPPPAPAHAADEFYFPDPDPGVAALPERQREQLAHAGEIAALHDFHFTDRLPESGITFVHQAVDDSGREYKMVHYDHGDGVAVADVDGDGRLDLYFVSQLGGNQLWHNEGNGRFRDITAAAGVGLLDQISVAPSFADVDNDGDPDLFVTTVRHGNHLFRNDGHGHFTDVTAASGLTYSGHSSGAVFFDYDRDGRLDLFLVNVGRYTTDQLGRGGYNVGLPDAFQGHLHPDRSERSILYHNAGDGRFVDVSDQVLAHSAWSGDATALDLDGDGWLDLYVLSMQGDDHFYHNDHGKRFVEETAAHFPKTPWGAMGIKAFDYDDDGRVDLMLTDMHSDMSAEVGVADEKKKSHMQWSEAMLQGGANNVFGNALYHNLGGGAFVEVSDQMGVEDYWPWGLSSGDLNADGYQDLFITASMSFPFRYGINSLLLNDGGKVFRDAEFILGVEPRRGGRTHRAFTTWDCDGVDKPKTPCAGRTGLVKGMSTLGSRSSVIFDLDGDGDLDIVTNDFNAEPQVLVSDLTQRHPISWLQVALHGTTSNRDGLGAKVVVKAGGHTYTQWMDGKSGYLSQSSMPLYFGLGAAKTVDEVEVTWPSGVTETVPKPKADAVLEVTEKAGH